MDGITGQKDEWMKRDAENWKGTGTDGEGGLRRGKGRRKDGRILHSNKILNSLGTRIAS